MGGCGWSPERRLRCARSATGGRRRTREAPGARSGVWGCGSGTGAPIQPSLLELGDSDLSAAHPRAQKCVVIVILSVLT